MIYASILALIASLVSVGYQSPVEQQVEGRDVSRAAIAVDKPSVDQLMAADLAATTAMTANLPVASNVSSLSISLNAKSQLAQSDENVLTKPQIIEADGEQRGIVTYQAVAGDSVGEIADRFGISAQTIKWANDLESDALMPGQKLLIPGTDGLVYTVQDGDTTQKLAERYKSNEQRIISYNDLELSGLKPGTRIVLPGGNLPQSERPGYSAPSSGYNSGSSSIVPQNGFTRAYIGSEGNRYAYGYCTWYAFNRRAELGRPIGGMWGDAVSWGSYAQSAGFRVNNTPSVGAVLHAPWVAAPYGHVAVVESVGADGSIVVSEMNYAGWNIVSQRTIGAGTASSYNYIH